MNGAGDAALELAEQAWQTADGDAADALVQVERSGLARFAASQVHQPTLIENESVVLRVVRDGRVGTAATNRTDARGLRAVARRAEIAADSAPRDPGFPGLAGPLTPRSTEGFDAETAELSPEGLASLTLAAIGPDAGLRMYGYLTSAATEIAVASSTGLAVHQAMTDASVLVLAANGHRSGYAAGCSWRVGELDPAGVAAAAAGLAIRTGGAVEIPPARYRAVLCPAAFADLLQYFAWTSISGRALLEGRSYLTGRIGERAFHPSLTLVDDGSSPEGLPRAFDFEGVPKQPVVIVEHGVVRDVVWDRRSAAAAGDGQSSTGHALPAPGQGFGPVAMNLAVHPGDVATDELPALVGDGILVTRLHYLSVVDEREGIITGMTRDGTFRIRDGEVAEPLVNLRFTTSFPALLRDLLGISRETERVSTADFYGDRVATASVVPSVATASFEIVGTGSGPGL